MITVYISAGNSDDKLTQADWAAFQQRVVAEVQGIAVEVHGVWHSAPMTGYQNMCICAVLNEHGAGVLRDELAGAAADFRQESIAWAEVPQTEFVSPAAASG